MTDTTASVNAKGLDATGFTEEIAGDLFNKVGTHIMAIVDLQVVDKHGPNVKGKRKVVLSIDGIEPAVDDNLAEHLRELTRTLYFNRQTSEDQPTLDESTEPDLETVLAAGRKHEPHPFLPVDAADDNPICDVCGEVENRPQHADREALRSPFDLDDADEEDEEDEEDEDLVDDELEETDQDDTVVPLR